MTINFENILNRIIKIVFMHSYWIMRVEYFRQINFKFKAWEWQIFHLFLFRRLSDNALNFISKRELK